MSNDHECKPPGIPVDDGTVMCFKFAVGEMWQCECGQVWVATNVLWCRSDVELLNWQQETLRAAEHLAPAVAKEIVRIQNHQEAERRAASEKRFTEQNVVNCDLCGEPKWKGFEALYDWTVGGVRYVVCSTRCRKNHPAWDGHWNRLCRWWKGKRS